MKFAPIILPRSFRSHCLTGGLKFLVTITKLPPIVGSCLTCQTTTDYPWWLLFITRHKFSHWPISHPTLRSPNGQLDASLTWFDPIQAIFPSQGFTCFLSLHTKPWQITVGFWLTVKTVYFQSTQLRVICLLSPLSLTRAKPTEDLCCSLVRLNAK